MAWQTLVQAFAKALLKKKIKEEAGKQGTGDSNLEMVMSALSKDKATQKPEKIPEKDNIPQTQADTQFVPGPNGTIISGQGEAMPGYGMESPQSPIPSQYRQFIRQPVMQYVQENPPTMDNPTPSTIIPPQYQNFGQQSQIDPNRQIGWGRGAIDALTGQPQPTGITDPNLRQGRRTAYYAGGLIPNILMSKLGQPSPAEAAGQQALLAQRQNMSGQAVIDPETGQILYNRPKGSVFQPPALGEKEAVVEEQKKERATKERIDDFKGMIGQFEKSYDELNASLSTIGTTGLKGAGTRLLGSIGEKAGYFPETTAFLRELKPKANQMARTIEGGRVTDEDRQIYADSFINALSAPTQTNVRLFSNSLIDAYNKGGDINPIIQILNSSGNEVLQAIVAEVNKQTETQGNRIGRFTVEVE